jgi:cobalt-precorrin 5A hydrolase
VIRIAGIGLNSRATPEAVAEVLARFGDIDGIATLADRAARLRRMTDVPVRGVASVAGVATPSQSPRVMALFGTGSIAESCALIGAGNAARIIVPRLFSADGTVTAALAEGDGP